MNNKDLGHYIDLCDSYTDFHKEGLDTINAMRASKYKTKALLDGVRAHMPKKNENYRSQ
jgi:hypothetical protein